jgi:hypothetical protein
VLGSHDWEKGLQDDDFRVHFLAWLLSCAGDGWIYFEGSSV